MTSSSAPWHLHFLKGIEAFKGKNHFEAIECFNMAIELAEASKVNTSNNSSLSTLYDSRAAVHLQLNNVTPGLLDAKRVIELAPERWQGYARSARGFLQARKFPGAKLMLGKARERVKTGDERYAKRIAEFDTLEKEIIASEQEVRDWYIANSTGGANTASSSVPHTSPLSRLPWELTVAVFKEVARIPHGTPHDSVPSGSSTLLQLTWVCRHWRTIAHSVPNLWQRLVLTKVQPERKAKFWIGRAKGQIRHIVLKQSFLQAIETLRFTQKAKTPAAYLTEDVLEGLAWDGIRAFTAENWPMPHCLYEDQALSRLLPGLETLELLNEPSANINAFNWGRLLLKLGGVESSLSMGDDGQPVVINKITHTPHILHLTLEGGGVSFASFALSQIQNLRSLRLRRIHFSPNGDLMTVLRLNPGLEVLELEGHSSLVAISSTACSLVLPKLSQLRLTGNFDLKNIFQHLALPNLRILDLSSNSVDLTPTLRHLVMTLSTITTPEDSNMSSPTTPVLEELRFSSCSFNPTVMVDLLRVSPSLRTLAICRYSSDVNPILESLISTSGPNVHGSETMCPALQEIDISHSPNVTTGPIVRLVKARLGDPGQEALPSVAKIERIRMDGCPRIEHTALPWLRANVKTLSCVYADKKAAGFRR